MGIKRHKVVELPIDKITFFNNDLKDHDHQDFEKLKNTLQLRGQVRNVVVVETNDEKYLCVEGSKIVKAMRQLNETEVNCVNLGKLSKPEYEHLRIEISRDFFFPNYVTVGELLKNLKKTKILEDVCRTIPYTVRQCENMISMTEFDWETLNNSKTIEGQVTLFDFIEDENDNEEIDFAVDGTTNTVVVTELEKGMGEIVQRHELTDNDEDDENDKGISNRGILLHGSILAPLVVSENNVEEFENTLAVDQSPGSTPLNLFGNELPIEPTSFEKAIARAAKEQQEKDYEAPIVNIARAKTPQPTNTTAKIDENAISGPLEEKAPVHVGHEVDAPVELVEDPNGYRYYIVNDSIVINDESIKEKIFTMVIELSRKFVETKYPSTVIENVFNCFHQEDPTRLIQTTIEGKYGTTYRVKPKQIIEELEKLIPKF